MQPILDIAQRHNLRIIEDSCETMFASYRGQKVGVWGDIGCFSTYIAHYIVTGVGGLATTNDPELAVMLKSLMNHGRDSIYLTIDDDRPRIGSSCSRSPPAASSSSTWVIASAAPRLEAAIGLAQLEQTRTPLSPAARLGALLSASSWPASATTCNCRPVRRIGTTFSCSSRSSSARGTNVA